MKLFFHYFFLITMFIACSCSCMHSLTTEHQKNAGHFGKLPQEVVTEIAGYCESKDRCAMRCTGKFLNHQLQCLKENDKNFLLKRKKLRYKILKQNLNNYTYSNATATRIVGQLCYYADITLELIAFLYGINFMAMAIDIESGRWLRFPLIGISLQLPLCLTASALLTEQKAPVYLYNGLLRRPIIHICEYSQYLLNRKKIAQTARHSFYDQQEYLTSKLNLEVDVQTYKNNLQAKRAQKEEQLRETSVIKKLTHHLHQFYKWLTPSITRLFKNNISRSATRLHRDILNALPPRKQPHATSLNSLPPQRRMLSVKYDE